MMRAGVRIVIFPPATTIRRGAPRGIPPAREREGALRHAAVDSEDRAGRVARCVAREVERGADDLGGLAGAPEREARRLLRVELVHVPAARQIGEDRKSTRLN